jgi:hypothetical protein
MMFTSAITAAALAVIATAVPVVQERQTSSGDGNFALTIGGGRFDPSYLQTFKLSYANSSAWTGQIKYQDYSEPLIVSGWQC